MRAVDVARRALVDGPIATPPCGQWRQFAAIATTTLWLWLPVDGTAAEHHDRRDRALGQVLGDEQVSAVVLSGAQREQAAAVEVSDDLAGQLKAADSALRNVYGASGTPSQGATSVTSKRRPSSSASRW